MGFPRHLVRPVLRGALRRPVLTARVLVDRIDENPSLVVPSPGRSGSARAQARALWQAGELSAAITTLPPADRLRRRFEGEVRVYGPRPVPAGSRVPVEGLPGRVLHLVTNALPYAQAGYTLRTHRIVCAQRAAGLAPHVVTAWGWPAAHGHPDARARVRIDGVPYHRLIPPGPIPVAADARLARAVDDVAALTRTLRPAVLHAATDHRNGTVALAVRERTGLPVVYEVRGFLDESWAAAAHPVGADRPVPERVRLHRDRDTAIMRAADLVTTLSHTMRAEILSRGVPAEKVVLTPNAVDADLLTATPDAAAVRRELGIGSGEFVVGSVSKLARYEGFDVLLRAAAELRARGVRIRVLLVGDGPERGELARLRTELGLDRTVLMPGKVAPAAAHRALAALDVFVCARLDLPVTRLVTPLKPLEAMALGRPMVLSDLPALRELAEDARATAAGAAEQATDPAAELVRPGDSTSLADALARLAADPARRSELAAAGREVVARAFTWARLAETYRQIYAIVR